MEDENVRLMNESRKWHKKENLFWSRQLGPPEVHRSYPATTQTCSTDPDDIPHEQLCVSNVHRWRWQSSRTIMHLKCCSQMKMALILNNYVSQTFTDEHEDDSVRYDLDQLGFSNLYRRHLEQPLVNTSQPCTTDRDPSRELYDSNLFHRSSCP